MSIFNFPSLLFFCISRSILQKCKRIPPSVIQIYLTYHIKLSGVKIIPRFLPSFLLKSCVFYNPSICTTKPFFSLLSSLYLTGILLFFDFPDNMSAFQPFHLFSAVLQYFASSSFARNSSPSLIRILEFSSAGLSIFTGTFRQY